MLLISFLFWSCHWPDFPGKRGNRMEETFLSKNKQQFNTDLSGVKRSRAKFFTSVQPAVIPPKFIRTGILRHAGNLVVVSWKHPIGAALACLRQFARRDIRSCGNLAPPVVGPTGLYLVSKGTENQTPCQQQGRKQPLSSCRSGMATSHFRRLRHLCNGRCDTRAVRLDRKLANLLFLLLKNTGILSAPPLSTGWHNFCQVNNCQAEKEAGAKESTLDRKEANHGQLGSVSRDG